MILRTSIPWLLRVVTVVAVSLASVRAPLEAMSVLERDFSALVARAEQIVVGTVSRIAAGTDPNGGPLTLVTFRDLTVLKGDVGATFTLEFSGGATPSGGLLNIPDMPTFEVGERAVLFVAGNGRDVCPLVGLWQGRFRVVHDDATGADVVERSDGARIVGLEGSKLRAARRGASPSPISVADFSALIREEMAHPSTPSGGVEP